MRKILISSQITFKKKPNFLIERLTSLSIFFPEASPIQPSSKNTPERLIFSLSSPSFQTSKKPNPKKQPKPLWRAVGCASMCENTCRSCLLPCCSFDFILFYWIILSSGTANICGLKPSVSLDTAHWISSISQLAAYHSPTQSSCLGFPYCIFNVLSK